LKWDACITPESRHSVSFSATVVGGMTQAGKARILREVQDFRPGDKAKRRPDVFAARR
jgi:hypothetical protein